jgi:AraC family transcriptional regulator, melibiose operon regulatory protein
MPVAHRHDDIELNLVGRGSLEYVFGGEPVTVPAGRLALFWAATPHRLLESTDSETIGCWMHIPLRTVLGWRLPDDIIARLMRDRPAIVDAAQFGDVAAMFERWEEDLRDPATVEIALLEAQALIRRATRARSEDPPAHTDSTVDTGTMSNAVTAMAQLIATGFREPLTIADVAGAARLHPSAAMASFRLALGVTIGTYLSRCRVAEAQRLLIAGAMPVADVGHLAGFGSQSAFYSAFTRATGRSPGAYRRYMRLHASRERVPRG